MTLFRSGQYRLGPLLGTDRAVDATLDIEAAGKGDIAANRDLRSDQGLDLTRVEGGIALVATKHGVAPDEFRGRVAGAIVEGRYRPRPARLFARGLPAPDWHHSSSDRTNVVAGNTVYVRLDFG